MYAGWSYNLTAPHQNMLIAAFGFTDNILDKALRETESTQHSRHAM